MASNPQLMGKIDYRWFPEGKVIFVAPTKPLVAQQLEACLQSCGIPSWDVVELTGEYKSQKRTKEVSKSFFCGS